MSETWEEWTELVRSGGLTYRGGRQERAWLEQSLGGFYFDRLITDVLFLVKGGKEATVYCCRAHPVTGRDLIAAKVFRPRAFRAMKNDALYKTNRGLRDIDGKQILDQRSLRAIEKRTSYGRFLDSAAWCQHEYQTLGVLHEGGADVPRPLAYAAQAILMEFVGDEHGAAPVLHGVDLEPGEAETLFDRLLDNVALFLSRYVVHADLSAFNVLYWDGLPHVIDLPQAIDPLGHPRAYELFQRDVRHLCTYFAKQGVESEPLELAHDLWRQCVG